MANSRLRALTPLLAAGAMWSCGGGGGSEGEAHEATASIPPLTQPATNFDSTAAPVGIEYWGDNSNAAGGRGERIDGIPCTQVGERFHVHLHLTIMLNEQQLAIPARLGQVPATATAGSCIYQVNHDKGGHLHVESPVPVNYQLGSFFKIWGQPLSRTNVGGITGLPIVVYVTDNGTTVRHEGDPSTIELRSKRLITIQIGAQLTELPNFTWSGT